jgi:Tol biopolymer transport system component
MNRNGSDKTRLEEGFTYDIEWSPDGTKIAYVKEEPGSEKLISTILLTDKNSLCEGRTRVFYVKYLDYEF